MNKIATYLNEHILGEATSSKSMRRRFSRDNSVLTITPEIIVFPRSTNDIRKVARFSWQLAEKGHKMGLTMRGTGADVTGGSIGKGIVIDTSAHLHNILMIAGKDRLAHVQPGVKLDVLQEALRWQGLSLAQEPEDRCHATVGGTIANDSFGENGAFADSVEKLEVILANGDVIETGRVNRHVVNKKLGLQTFEGEIYRKISGIIEDNEELINNISSGVISTTGYPGIARVKRKDGSMDLTPLFIGSQGTLGAISEVVMKTDYYRRDKVAAIILAETGELARDIADRVAELKPTALMTIDAELINRVHESGKKFATLGGSELTGAVVYLELGDFKERARNAKLKKLRKLALKMKISLLDSTNRDIQEFNELRSVARMTNRIAEDDKTYVPILLGAAIPKERREEFIRQVSTLAHAQHVELPLSVNLLTNTVDAFPQLKLSVVGDKQKTFRLMSEYASLVHKCGGAFTSNGAEGRVKANAAWAVLEDDEVRLYEEIRAVFDPFHTLNPGVKQKAELRTLVADLRPSYDTTDFVA